MPAEPTALEKLRVRVAKGIEWLTEHDPIGRYHLWYEAGLDPRGPFPAQESQPDVVAGYAEYFKQRNLWERLSRELARVDPSWRDSPTTLGDPQLQWTGGVR